jgi:hypothetical protein
MVNVGMFLKVQFHIFKYKFFKNKKKSFIQNEQYFIYCYLC